MHVVVAAV